VAYQTAPILEDRKTYTVRYSVAIVLDSTAQILDLLHDCMKGDCNVERTFGSLYCDSERSYVDDVLGICNGD
jgi:hypothetical protein